MSHQIKLKAINLQNFGIHADLTVNFTDTLTVIKGPNGSGKTTILQGIFFALFGTSAVDGVASDLPRTGSKTCAVELHISADIADYAIMRSLKDATVRRFDDGALVASGHTSVNSWIEDKFGVGQKQALQLMYSEQTETAAMMTLGATALNRMIEKIAQAEFITRVEQSSDKLADKAENQVEVLSPVPDVAQLQESADTVNNELTELIAHNDKIAAQLTEADNSRQTLMTQVSEAKVLAEKIRQLETRQRELNILYTVETEALLSKREELNAITTNAESVEALRVEIAKLKSSTNAMQISANTQVSNERRVSQMRGWLDTIGDAAVAEYNRVLPQLQEKQLQSDNARAELAESETIFDRVRKARMDACDSLRNAACPTCKRAFSQDGLDSATARAAELKAQETVAGNQVTTLQGISDRIQRELALLKKELPEHETVLLHSAYTKELVLLKAEIDSCAVVDMGLLEQQKTSLATLTHQLGTAESELKRKEMITANVDTLLKSIFSLERTYANRQIDLDALVMPDVDAITQAYEEARTVSANLATKYASIKSAIMQATSVRARCLAELENARTLIEQRAALEKRAAGFNGLTKFLRTNRSVFMSELWAQLMLITSDFVSTVTQGRIDKIERDDDGGFYYWERGARRRIAKLAGGLKAVAGVGMRVALASLLPAGVGFVCLDEPSSELADDLAAALAGALRGTGRQIVMVSHRSGEEFASDAVIELTL